jgi:hypothetical protein
MGSMDQEPSTISGGQPGWFIGKFGTNGFHTEMDLKTGELIRVLGTVIRDGGVMQRLKGEKRIRTGKKTPPFGRAYVTVIKEKEIWGRVEFLWDKVNGRFNLF